MRTIPEERIRSLETIQLLFDPLEADLCREHMIRNAGMEIARKLAEFHKIELRKRNGRWELYSRIEVIVPLTPENPWPKRDT